MEPIMSSIPTMTFQIETVNLVSHDCIINWPTSCRRSLPQPLQCNLHGVHGAKLSSPAFGVHGAKLSSSAFGVSNAPEQQPSIQSKTLTLVSKTKKVTSIDKGVCQQIHHDDWSSDQYYLQKNGNTCCKDTVQSFRLADSHWVPS